MRLPIVGVIGSGTLPYPKLASAVGRMLAGLGVHLLTGCGSGVMFVVSQAFAEIQNRKGMVIGILPCHADDPLCPPKPGYPNPYVEIAVATHLPLSGDQGTDLRSRNHINVLSSDVLIALPGGAGTQSEVVLALRYQKPVIAYLGENAAHVDYGQEVPIAKNLHDVESFLRDHLKLPRSIKPASSFN